jgi:eukaryotic-like serine/threonine-protein kinase
VQVTTFGRYQLLDLIGRGTTGKVYRANDSVTNEVVAVKVLKAELEEDPQFVEQFRRELPTAAGLTNSHVVPIHNYGQIGGELYVDMQLIDGCNLGRLIRNEGGRLLPVRAVAITKQVAAALDGAHREGLVHRDVKPSNILVVPPNDFTYLTDFGMARSAEDTAVGSMGHVPGAYMAPERFSGAGDYRADVYSLACVLYKCVTGQQPFPGDSLAEQRAAHLAASPPRPSTSSPGIPPAFNAVIAAGMAKSPRARYQTAPQLAEAARAALEGRFVPPPSPPPPPPGTTATPRRPRDEPAPAEQPESQRNALAILGGMAVAMAALFGVIAMVIVTATTSDQSVTATTSTTPTTKSAASTPASSATATTTPAPVAPPAIPQLPSFVPSASVGANCQYVPSNDAADITVSPPDAGSVSTDPARIGVSIVTNRGKIGLQLANNESPCTVNSFVSLARQKFFDDTKCHRLTTSPGLSVLQCGDPKGDGTGGPGYQFANEYPTDQYRPGDPALKKPVRYPRGTVAMANGGPNTNGSQFFMVYRDSELPPAYTVFGTVDAAGLATLDKIAAAGVAGGGDDGTPATEVTIRSARPSSS